MHQGRLPGRQQGFSLVEMMVAMVLGLLLVAAVMQVFLSNRASYRFNQALSTVQDNARFALHTLGRDLRMSGYSGCPKSVDLNINVISDTADLDEEELAESISPPGDLPDSGEAAAVAGNDAFRITYMRDYGVRVASDPSGANIQVTANPDGWKQGDVLLVVDCLRGKGDLFTATNQCPASGPCTTIAHAIGSDPQKNTTNSLSETYTERARILSPYRAVYYVGDTGKTDSAGNPIHALYLREIKPNGVVDNQPLLQGVDDLTIRYGIDNNADASPDNYVAIGSVADWEDVVALRVGFVAKSDRPAGADSRTLDLFGIEITPPDDGYLRHPFTTTVALRNRVP